jgi:3-(3-hydroxy-phenyl)propionate hydroxylase
MLGLKLQGDSFDSRYLIADIEMDCEWPTERKVWFNPTSNPNSTVIMHRQPDNVWRIDYQLLRDQDSEAELEGGNIRRRIDAHLKFVGLNCSWRLLWKSLYQARTLSLRNYVHERVIFAGDAAHLVPIFGVRGLNSGLDDAMNLGWKLPYVLRGLASPRLLATYDRERRDAYQENISNAIKTTWFMSPPTDGFIIARDAILELATVNPQFRQLIDPRQSSFHRYRSEAILENPDCAYIGLPLSEVSLADGSNVHQWLGPEFSTIAVSPNAGAVETRHEEIDGVSVRHVTVPQSWLSGELDLRPGQLIFVRPDSYVSAFRHEGEASRTRDIIAGCLAGTRVAREGTHAG